MDETTTLVTPEQTVTIDMPVEQPAIVAPITEPIPPVTEPVSTSYPQETQQPPIEAKQEELSTEKTEEKPKTNEGRPCEFCADKEAILVKTKAYIETGKGEKPKILFLNEVALLLDKHRETIMEWAHRKNKDGSLEHPEFSDMIKSVEEIQELRLQQRILGRYNPSGAIFLLKTKHGYIESEKRILAGDTKEPLEIIITEERKIEE